MKILVIAPNHQIFRLYVEACQKIFPLNTARDIVHVREEHSIAGYPIDTPVIIIGLPTAEDINLRLDVRRRFTNIKTLSDIP